MRLEQLEYLLTIHKTHSINLAGKKLHTSQQNISQSIKSLEAELNLQLLERRSSGTLLTPAGLVVLKHAKKIFHELSDLEKELNTFQSPNRNLKGQLKILYATGFNTEYIFNSLERFTDDYPNIKVYLYQESIANVLNSLYKQTADLGLIASSDDFHFGNTIAPEKMRDLTLQYLKEEPLLAAVSHLSPLADQKSITAAKLLQYPLVFFYHEQNDPGESNYLFEHLSQYGTPRIHIITNAFELYAKAITNGQSIGFMTQAAKNTLSYQDNDEIILLPIQPPISLLQGYAINNTTPMTPALTAYLPYLLEQF